MLRNIVEGKETSACVLVQDTTGRSGHGLLKAILCGMLTRLDEVHLVLYEAQPQAYVAGLPADMQQRLHCHDAASDPLGWENMESGLNISADLCCYLVKQIKTRGKVAVVLDSLTSLILHRGAAYTCKVLHKLSQGKGSPTGTEIQVAALCHKDLHDDTTLDLLHHTTTTVVTVTSSPSHEHQCMCELRHCRPSGKVIRTKENFNIKKSYQLDNVQEVTSSLLSQGPQDTTVDPTANLTFNLTLTDKEKADRSQVVLPYMMEQNTSEVALHGPGSGKIFYQPDEADDFDEEDPDDDLDI